MENSDVAVSHISDKAVLSDVAANVQCTDTSVEAVNFQADSFSIYGISLLTENTEDGIFRDGTAGNGIYEGWNRICTVLSKWKCSCSKSRRKSIV